MLKNWTPIVAPESSLSHAAWNSVAAIAASVLARDYPMPSTWRRSHATYENALLFAYLGCALDDILWKTRAVDALNDTIDHIGDINRDIAIIGGLSGLGWVAHHVSDLLDIGRLDEDSQESGTAAGGAPEIGITEWIDSALLRKLSRDWRGSFDLISGLVGVGVYFFERLESSAAAKEGLILVMNHLESLAEHHPEGITWHTPPGSLPEVQRQRTPYGYYCLGVAHGVPGVIHFLSQMTSARIEEHRARALLEPAVEWLIAHQRPRGSLSFYSPYITATDSFDSRLSWCYGDLGILAIIMQAGNAGSSLCKAHASELLEHCLAWPPERAGVNDAQMCHGTVGLAHIFNRLFHLTGDGRCRERALFWIERTLQLQVPNAGVAGYQAFTRPEPTGGIVWEPNPAFLDGAIGIALCLTAALSPVEPKWDRLLLLSRTSGGCSQH